MADSTPMYESDDAQAAQEQATEKLRRQQERWPMIDRVSRAWGELDTEVDRFTAELRRVLEGRRE